MRGESFDDRADDARQESERAAEARAISAQAGLFSDSELGLDASQRVLRFLHAERWTGVSLGLHVLALLCMALMPPKSSALALDLLGEDARYARYLAAPVELDSPPLFEPARGNAAEGARAADSEGAAGAPDAPRKPGGRPSGRRSSPAPATDARTEARAAGILGVLPGFGASMGDDQGPFGPLAIYDEEALALVTTPGGVGEGFGFGGIGMRGTGRGGGGDVVGAVGMGKMGNGFGSAGICGGGPCTGGFRGRDAKVPPVRTGIPDVHGSLSKEAIRRAIQRHLNEVRFCYTEGLRVTPELAGRVQVMFMITSAGTVQEARVTESDLHQPVVERCIAEAVRRWSFPAPDGGGYVTVRYPFVFEQLGQ